MIDEYVTRYKVKELIIYNDEDDLFLYQRTVFWGERIP